MQLMNKIKITDYIKLHIANYVSFTLNATVLKVEEGEVDANSCYVKIKVNHDYYIHNDNYQVIDIDFDNKIINGTLNLNKTLIIN